MNGKATKKARYESVGNPGIFVAGLSPAELTASRAVGKTNGKMTFAGWRVVRSTERRAICPTWASVLTGFGLGLGLRFLLLGRALERAARLGEEDVVEARRVQLELLELDPLGVERTDDSGQVLDAVLEPDRHAFRRASGLLAELLQDAGDRLRARAVGGNGLDRRPADLRLQLLGRALGDDVPVVDDPDPVGERVGLLEVLRREEDGHALVAGEPGDLGPERASALRVEARRRLVEEEDRRPVHEREREVEPALHAARVAADLAVGGEREPDPLEQLLRPGPALGAWDAVERALQPEVLAAGEQVVECGLLERGADRRADLRPLLHDVEAGDARGARRGGQERRQHVHRRRLPGAVRAEEAVDLAGLDAQVDPVDRA